MVSFSGAHNLGIQEYENIELPIVSFDRYLAEGIPIISSDNLRGGYLATENLYLKGARNIAIPNWLPRIKFTDQSTIEWLFGIYGRIPVRAARVSFFILLPAQLLLKNLEIKRILEMEKLMLYFVQTI